MQGYHQEIVLSLSLVMQTFLKKVEKLVYETKKRAHGPSVEAYLRRCHRRTRQISPVLSAKSKGLFR